MASLSTAQGEKLSLDGDWSWFFGDRNVGSFSLMELQWDYHECLVSGSWLFCIFLLTLL